MGSCKHRTPSPTPGPVRGEFKHHFKHPITLPHQRDIRSKSGPTYEVDKSHQYLQSETHRDDMKQMVGPVYSTGKIADEKKHHFTDGYVAPMTRERREEQVKLVTKYFQKEKSVTDNLKKKIIDKAEALSINYAEKASKITREEALKLGEARKREALQRREEQLKAQAAKKAISSEFESTTSKTVVSAEEYTEYGSMSDLSYGESNQINVPSSFSLKKETSLSLTPKAEKNTTAIGYHQFIQKKGQIKTKSENLTENVEGQVVFAKEFTPNRQLGQKHNATLVVRGKSDKESEEVARLESIRIKEAENTARQKEVEKEKLEKAKMEEQARRQEAERQKQEEIKQKLAQEEEQKQIRAKLELEKQNILLEEQKRKETLAREKVSLQKKSEEMMSEQTLKQNEINLKEGLKKSLFKVSRQEQPGVGFGSVRTGYVNNKRISLLQRASSAEPPSRQTSSSPAPTKRQKSVRFSGNADSVMIRSPSPRPFIKTGDVASGVANWTQRVSELDKTAAAAQTPPVERKTTVVKFGQRASSESRTFQFGNMSPVSVGQPAAGVQQRSVDTAHQQQITSQSMSMSSQSVRQSFTESMSDSTHQSTMMGSRTGSISSLMSIVPSSERSSARLSPPISICSEKSA